MTPLEFCEARTTLGLTQTEFGKLLGVSHAEISRKERGQRPISAAQALTVKTLLTRQAAPR